MVNCLDGKGGASAIAVDLFKGLREAGHEAWLGVGRKTLDDENVLPLSDPPALRAWEKACHALARRVAPGSGTPLAMPRLARFAREVLAHPVRAWHESRGLEVFNYPGSRNLLERVPAKPDLIHCHNLHHAYFDLNLLPGWSRRHPLALTLHDAWLLAGHCVHSFDCERWRTGCGECPGLHIYPSLKRDGTASNFRRKRRIYAASRLYVATPSRWLLNKVERSMLAEGIRRTRVIPNGVDTGVFRPGDRAEARHRLGLPQDAFIVLFVAEDPNGNMWKDYATLKRAFARLKDRFRGRAVLLALGAGGTRSDIQGDVRLLPFLKDPAMVAEYYRASDVYAHAARAETFPTVILEAMACGTAVVASAVGGIPEQVRDGSTGYLVGPGDDAMLAERLAALESDPELARSMGERGQALALERFSNKRMLADYLDWYEEAMEDFARLKP
jgi:glycosyltransferase involved in cell wall biosynthesis